MFGTTVRNKRHGAEDGSGQDWVGGYTRWLRPTWSLCLADRCSFLCVSGQRGTIAKSMHEEHLCVVALTSMERGNPVLSACLLPPCVIAYCSSSTSR